VGVTWEPVEAEPDCVAVGVGEEFVEVGEGLIMGVGEAVGTVTGSSLKNWRLDID
jgi:hypothetical protein